MQTMGYYYSAASLSLITPTECVLACGVVRAKYVIIHVYIKRDTVQAPKYAAGLAGEPSLREQGRETTFRESIGRRRYLHTRTHTNSLTLGFPFIPRRAEMRERASLVFSQDQHTHTRCTALPREKMRLFCVSSVLSDLMTE